MTSRSIRGVHPAHRDDIGDLVTRRPLPGPDIDHLDPFLFLNHHGPQRYAPGNRGLPFEPHPHRGFETVTFIVEGSLAHRDSAGHESVIHAGGVQWMTAGRGIVHAEVSPVDFLRQGGPLEILQLWVNLPSRLKMSEPRYVGLQRDDIPRLRTGDGRGTIHLVSGSLGDLRGAVESLTGLFMSTVELEPEARVRFDGLAGRSVFLYVVRGRICIDSDDAHDMTLVDLTPGDDVEIRALQHSLIVFAHAAPIGEPVVSYGPFVMNTETEIREAIADYQAGKFGPLA